MNNNIEVIKCKTKQQLKRKLNIILKDNEFIIKQSYEIQCYFQHKIKNKLEQKFKVYKKQKDWVIKANQQINQVHKFLDQLSKIQFIAIKDLELHQKINKQIMFSNPEIYKVLKQFFVDYITINENCEHYRRGDLILYYKEISQNLALQKSYYFSGFLHTRLEMQFQSSNFQNIGIYQKKILLKQLNKTYFEYIKKVIAQQNGIKLQSMHMSDIIQFEVIGFRKNLYDFYIQFNQFINKVKYKILKYYPPIEQSRLKPFHMKFKKHQQQKNTITIKNNQKIIFDKYILLEKNYYIIVFEEDQFPLDILEQLDCRTNNFVNRFTKEQFKFIYQNQGEFVKKIKRQVSYVELIVEVDQIEIVCNDKNLQKAFELTNSYLYYNFEYNQTYKFQSEFYRVTFMKYFYQKNKFDSEIIKDEFDRIQYFCKKFQQQKLEKQLKAAQEQISNKYVHALINHNIPIYNKEFVKVDQSRYIKSHSLIQTKIFSRKDVKIKFVSDQYQSNNIDALVCVYVASDKKFFSKYCLQVLKANGYLKNDLIQTMDKKLKKIKENNIQNFTNSFDGNTKNFIIHLVKSQNNYEINKIIKPRISEIQSIGFFMPQDPQLYIDYLKNLIMQIQQYSSAQKTVKKLKTFYFIFPDLSNSIKISKILQKASFQQTIYPVVLNELQIAKLMAIKYYQIVFNSRFIICNLGAFCLGVHYKLSNRQKNRQKSICLLNLPSEQDVEEYLVDLTNQKIYNVKKYNEMSLDQYRKQIKNKISYEQIKYYIKYNYTISKKQKYTYLITLYLKNGEFINDLFLVEQNILKKCKFKKGKQQLQLIPQEYPFKVNTVVNNQCWLISGYYQEVLNTLRDQYY